jgi:heme exporter protein D
MLLAIFGIENTGLNLAVTFAVLALVAIWIALVVFTFSDARRRLSDPFLVGCATAASLFPFVGTVVYSILRPPEYLDDVQERQTEMKAAETRTRHLEANSCRKCAFPVQPDFVRCPACRTRLKDPCPSCSQPVGLKWKVCPYCEHTLIESKRARSSSKAGSRSASSEKRTTESPRDSGKRSASKPDGASRSARPTRKSPANAASDERPARGGREETSERPARSASRSGRRRVVVPDEDEPQSDKTINGGESKSGGIKSDG